MLACVVAAGGAGTVAAWEAVAGASSEAAAPDFEARFARAERLYRLDSLVVDATMPTWLPDGRTLLQWAATGPHAGTWILIDVEHRTVRPAITKDKLKGQLERLGLPLNPAGQPRFRLLPDGKTLIVRWDGSVLHVDLEAGEIARAADDASYDRLLLDNGAISPDGARVIASTPDGVRLAVKGQAAVPVTVPGVDTIDIGPSAWAPDGRWAVGIGTSFKGVHRLPVVDYASAIERVDLVPYPKAGTTLPQQSLIVVAPDGTSARQIHLDRDYAWLAGWRDSGSEALIIALSRDGKRLELLGLSPGDGRLRTIVATERPGTFVAGLEMVVDGWRSQVLPVRDGFVWLTEESGYRQAYLHDYTGRRLRRITHGDYPIHRVLGIAGNSLLAIASPEARSPYERVLMRFPLDGGRGIRLSKTGGIHDANLSPDGRYLVDGHSSRAQPRIWTASRSDGQGAFDFAKADASPLARTGYKPPEGFVALAADGKTAIHGAIFKPTDFDPTKRYPVLDYIYAGPFVAVVPWSYPGDYGIAGKMVAEATAMAEQGFIVVMIDARGTPGRSKAFQDANYGRVGEIEIPDHVAALRQAAASRPYMDIDRAGIVGHSWGGYFALRGMLAEPGFFRAGYAGAPGALEELAFINEPYMGLPKNNPAGYAAGSNARLAGNLKGALKIMHGTSDVNAPFGTSMAITDALVQAGKPFDFLVMPGQAHGPRPPADIYYLKDRLRFLTRELGTPQ